MEEVAIFLAFGVVGFLTVRFSLTLRLKLYGDFDEVLPVVIVAGAVVAYAGYGAAAWLAYLADFAQVELPCFDFSPPREGLARDLSWQDIDGLFLAVFPGAFGAAFLWDLFWVIRFVWGKYPVNPGVQPAPEPDPEMSPKEAKRNGQAKPAELAKAADMTKPVEPSEAGELPATPAAAPKPAMIAEAVPELKLTTDTELGLNPIPVVPPGVGDEKASAPKPGRLSKFMAEIARYLKPIGRCLKTIGIYLSSPFFVMGAFITRRLFRVEAFLVACWWTATQRKAIYGAYKTYLLTQLIRDEGDDFNRLELEASLDNSKHLLVTLSNSRVYYGFTTFKPRHPRLLASHGEFRQLQMIPLSSGYRDSVTRRVVITNYYNPAKGNSAEKPATLVEVPYSQIVAVQWVEPDYLYDKGPRPFSSPVI